MIQLPGQAPNDVETTLIKSCVLMLILFHGEPDIIDALVAFLMGFSS